MSIFCILIYILILLSLYIYLGVRVLSLNIFGKSICKIKNAPANTIYLTFDDGPNPNVTPKVLDLLREYNQRATFFCVAKNAEKYPEIIKRIINEEHTLASHDLNHNWSSNFRRTKQMTKEIGESMQILENIVNDVGAKHFSPNKANDDLPIQNTQIKYYRPPVGLSNPHLFKALKILNLQCVGWNKSTRDGGNRIISATNKIPKLALAKDGDIILLHDDCPIQNVDLFLERFQKLLIELQRAGKRSLAITI